MLIEYCPPLKKKKKDCRCKMVANIESKKVPPEFKTIQIEEDQVYYFTQRKPWVPRQGMPPNPLAYVGPYFNLYSSIN